MRSIRDLSTQEAYLLAVERLGEKLPPFDAIDNEDWGRDYVLERIAMHDDTELSRVGVSRH